MDYFYLFSDSEEDEINEALERRILRDKSNPLALTNSAFIKRFRLNKDAFVYVLSKLNFKGHMSTAVPAPLQLAATLVLLASGGYQYSIGNDYLLGMGQSTISKIAASVINEMETKLCPEHINFSETRWSSCKQWFFRKYKIPGVIGCVDGTHFGLQKPTENEAMFFNRKGFHSLNSMIICDHEYRILAVDSRYGGAAHDSFVWKHSGERRFLEQKFDPRRNENFWLLGDSGYPLEPWCITPYRSAQDGSDEAIFNEIHSKARSTVERTIGVLKGRWRILNYQKRGRYSPEKHASFGNVACALHNICIDFKVPFGEVLSAQENNIPDDVIASTNENVSRAAERIRNYIKHSLCNNSHSTNDFDN